MVTRQLQAFFIVILLGLLEVTNSFADSTKAAIASAHPLATDAGFEIIRKGGNVFDAAVAVSAALAVVEPSGSGLGGGGYWLLHREKDAFEVCIDGRERAPLAAYKTMYLDRHGKIIPRLSLDGALAAAIPGLPAALVHISEKYGRLPLVTSLAPAIRLAKFGYAVNQSHLKHLEYRLEALNQYPGTAAIFLHKGKLPPKFSILRQPDLANTLEQLAEGGQDGFYGGEIAEKLVDGVRKAGGLWTQDDLKLYRIIERQPVKSSYHRINITSAPPSSSGGVVLQEILNILSGFDLTKTDSATRKHLIVEAMRRAYYDRSRYLGDPDFIKIPMDRLLSQAYADELRNSILPDKATSSASLATESGALNQGENTTHFSIIDEEGNRVAATLSVNMSFGSAFVPEGTGILLNDEMDDFVSSPDEKNHYGLTGGAANAIAPGKRMLSSMTPTFLETPERIGVLGTPGGSRIISMVLIGVLDFAAGYNPDSWVKIPRFHHQYIPDVIEYEPGTLSRDEIKKLSGFGHALKEKTRQYGDMQAVQLNKLTHDLSAASDPRGEGKAWASP
jgi:gamma-glutamyltranspeptidase / glutathione hydrolase